MRGGASAHQLAGRCVLMVALVAGLAACKAAPSPAPRNTHETARRDLSTESAAPIAQDNAIQPDAMKGEVGARHVLGLWASALERGDWPTARAQWGDHGAMSGRTPEQYAAEYSKYRQMKIEVGRGEADAGAGSSFYTAPVVISGITREGQPFFGPARVHLRRVNDVPGATAEQLRWHIERIDYDSPPGS